MKKTIQSRLFWIIPMVLILIGFGLLFYEKLSHIIEPPAPGWSRAFEVGETKSTTLPPAKVTEKGEYVFTRSEEGKLAITTLDTDFSIKHEKTYNIPVDKWTKVFHHGETIIYFDFKHIKNEANEIIIEEADQFFPLYSTIFYIKNNELYQLHPDTLKTAKIAEIDSEKVKLVLQESDGYIHLLTYTTESNTIHLNVYEIHNEEMQPIYDTTAKVEPGRIVEEISFARDGDTIAFLMQEVLKSTQGKQQFFTSFMKTNIHDKDEKPFTPITFNDPLGNGRLSEVADAVLSFRNGQPHVLFQAMGRTNVLYNETHILNIYEAVIHESGTTSTERRSNTAGVSNNPQWLNDKTIAWVELEGGRNKINISSTSSNIQPPINNDDWLRAAGNALGKMILSLLVVPLSFVWFAGTILFMAAMYIFGSRRLVKDPPWYFYTGIGIYILSACIWSERFFIERFHTTAPSYLAFPGSTYLYIIVVAALAYGLTVLLQKENEWSGTGRIIYFMGVHIVLLTVFFGPYII